MRITGLYVALAAILILVLAIRVVLRRRALHVTLGDGGDKDLLKRIRAHANAIEYLPLLLLLLLMLELNQTQPIVLHIFGILILLARTAHAIALSVTGGVSTGRFVGIGFTWICMLCMSGLLLWQWLLHLQIP